MTIVAYAALVWLGLSFGSLVNALVWRLRQQELKAKSSKPKRRRKNSSWLSAFSLQPSARNKQLSILTGRSQCVHCQHVLAARDLIPVLSWLILRGRCRYCHQKISWQYPAVEIAAALVFGLSYAFWPSELSNWGQWLLFIDWLAVSVGLLALLVYDFRWMMLPSRIIYPTAAVAIAGRVIYIIGFEANRPRALLLWLLAVAVAAGLFWLLFEISKGRWIGFGDVRLGLITGTVLATPPKALLMIFMASVLGTLFVLPALLSGRQSMAARIPFGPFLIMSTWLTLLVGSDILAWYERFFLLK